MEAVVWSLKLRCQSDTISKQPALRALLLKNNSNITLMFSSCLPCTTSVRPATSSNKQPSEDTRGRRGENEMRVCKCRTSPHLAFMCRPAINVDKSTYAMQNGKELIRYQCLEWAPLLVGFTGSSCCVAAVWFDYFCDVFDASIKNNLRRAATLCRRDRAILFFHMQQQKYVNNKCLSTRLKWKWVISFLPTRCLPVDGMHQKIPWGERVRGDARKT